MVLILMVSRGASIALLAIALIAVAGALFYSQNQVSPTIKNLTLVEVRDVNGTALSSIADFRENSIAGSQYVNITNYRLSVVGLVAQNQSYTYQDILDRFQSYRKSFSWIALMDGA
jgi:DMSO/TMAO reductase YedYZ molybdopterin-dependent catalytic subunit